MNASKKRVVVALSGGVDSAVAASLLLRQGCEVVGVNLQMCSSEQATSVSALDPERIAQFLNIPFYKMNIEDSFQKNVISPFVNEYKMGRTPNPCVCCNKLIKFKFLFEKAKEFKMDYVATGHYARTIKLASGLYAVREGKDVKKNQAYYLYTLTQKQIASTLFPLGNLTKNEVREIALGISLPVASKPESQDICFIPDNDYRSFLMRQGLTFTAGKFIDRNGKILGHHDGKEKFTVGQRRGLNIAVGEPLYVLEILSSGDIVLGTMKDRLVENFFVTDVNFQGIDPKTINGWVDCRVQIRYRSRPMKAQMQIDKNLSYIKVKMIDEIYSAAPGQSAVFFMPDQQSSDNKNANEQPNDWIMSGGIIVDSKNPPTALF